MGLMDKIRGEFIDIVEWLDDSRDTIVWRFPRYENEIKMGAQLVVRESQTAVFVNEGVVADVFQPGMHTLETENLPILSTLKGWKYGFHSPFKAEVYFVSTRLFTDMKWGTQNPVIVRDASFGMVRLRAFGAYAARVTDPHKLVAEVAGTDPQFRTEEIEEYLRQTIVSRLSSTLASSGIGVLDLAAQQSTIATGLAGTLTEDLAPFGIQIAKFIIENISLPPEVEAAVDKRSQMAIVGDLGAYTQFEAATAIGDAARNPGGAGEGMGLGLGMALGQRMAAGLPPQAAAAPAQAGGAPPAAGPPPLPTDAAWYVAIDGAQRGPYDQATIARYAADGTITTATLVWQAGMSEWRAASDVAQVAALFVDSTPPPLPS
jgi:membrane protease subunit (stomatin/prohibitin family)